MEKKLPPYQTCTALLKFFKMGRQYGFENLLLVIFHEKRYQYIHSKIFRKFSG
jgi:hypothetical protein